MVDGEQLEKRESTPQYVREQQEVEVAGLRADTEQRADALPRIFFSAYTSVLPFCFFSNFTARSSIFGSSTLNDALDDKFWMLNFRRILLN